MNVHSKEALLALDAELEAKAEALRERLDTHTDPSELIDESAALIVLMLGRVLIMAILVILTSENVLDSRRSRANPRYNSSEA